MNLNNKFFGFIKQLLIALAFTGLAVLLRVLFFKGLGRGTAYLTFYPIIALAALFGTFASGIIATILSFFLTYFWIQKGSLSSIELMAEGMFVLSCILISSISGLKNRAKRREMIIQKELLEKNKKLIDETKAHEKADKELKARLSELESLNKYMVGRELKMVDLKKRINDLEKNK